MQKAAAKIVWEEVESSNIKAIGYDSGQMILFVQFFKGERKNVTGTFMYQEVSSQRYTAFLKAESMGSYFLKEIMPRYKAIKIG